jgi:hypothetical protein
VCKSSFSFSTNSTQEEDLCRACIRCRECPGRICVRWFFYLWTLKVLHIMSEAKTIIYHEGMLGVLHLHVCSCWFLVDYTASLNFSPAKFIAASRPHGQEAP